MGEKNHTKLKIFLPGCCLPVFVVLMATPLALGISLAESECLVNACNYTHSSLQCPRGHVILLTNVTCQGTDRHPCPKSLYLDMLNKCSGRQKCSVRLLALQKLQEICRKGLPVGMRYTCIRKPKHEEPSDACTVANRLTESHGFVYSPGYPKRYSKTPCWWKVFLNRGQDVLFTIFEMQSFFNGAIRDTPDFLRVSPSVPAPTCPFKQKDVVSFQEFRGDLFTVKQFRVRCHMEAEITLRQLSGAGRGVRLLLFYQVIPANKEVKEFIPGFLARACVQSNDKLKGYVIPERKFFQTHAVPVPTTTVTMTSESPVPQPTSDVDIVETHDNYIGLLTGLVVGGLFSVCLFIGVAVLCLRRRKTKSGTDYNSFSDGKTGSTATYGVSSEKCQASKATSGNPNRDISSGYATESDSSEEYDETNNPTYESIEKYRLNDTYSRVADEISSPPPAPKSHDEPENLDSISTTYAEIQSIMDERIPPEAKRSYREFVRKQLKALEKDARKTEATNNGPYAVSGYLCGEPEKTPNRPPKVPPKNSGNSGQDNDRASPESTDSSDSGLDKLPGEPIYSYPSNQDDLEDVDVIFVENDLYQPFQPT